MQAPRLNRMFQTTQFQDVAKQSNYCLSPDNAVLTAEAEQIYFKQMLDTRTNTTKQLQNNLAKKDKIAISKLLVNNENVTDS